MKRPLGFAGLFAIVSAVLLMAFGTVSFCVIPVLLTVCSIVFCVMKRYGTCKWLALAAAVFLFSSVAFYYNENCVVKPSLQLLDQSVSVKGTVYEQPKDSANSVIIPIEDCVINGKQTHLKVKLYAKSYDPIRIGDVVYINNAKIFDITGAEETYYHTLSTRCWLGAYSYAAAKTDGTSAHPLYLLRRFRANTALRLVNMLGEENGGIAAALLLGDKTYLTETFQTNLRISGASHVFAVSGMHLSVWAAVLFLILRKRSKSKIIPNVIAIVFVVFYMIMTGLSPSVLRAGIMLLFVFAGRIIRKASDPLNALGISALLLLSANIYLAGNISFLLSFAATFGLIVLYPYFQTDKTKNTGKVKRIAIGLKNAVFLSLTAMLFTLPVSAFFFGSVSLLSPVSSVLCSVPAEINMVSSFLGLALSYVPFLNQAILFILRNSCTVIKAVIGFLGQFDFCLYPVNFKYVLIWYMITGIIMLFVFFFKKRNARTVLLVLLCSVCILLTSQIGFGIVNRNNVEICVPAGQTGTSIIISSNNNMYHALIGTGETYDDYYTTRKYLQKQGAYTQDTLIVPRGSDAESGNLERYSETAKEIYGTTDNELLQTCHTAAISDQFTLRFPNGLLYRNCLSEEYAAGVLRNENIKIVYVFYPGSDLSSAPEELKNADYLICRADLPAGIELSDYTNVIVCTDKTAAQMRFPENVTTTGETGDIIIKTTVS